MWPRRWHATGGVERTMRRPYAPTGVMSDDDNDDDDDETIPFEHLITQTKYLQGLGIFRLALGLA